MHLQCYNDCSERAATLHAGSSSFIMPNEKAPCRGMLLTIALADCSVSACALFCVSLKSASDRKPEPSPDNQVQQQSRIQRQRLKVVVPLRHVFIRLVRAWDRSSILRTGRAATFTNHPGDGSAYHCRSLQRKELCIEREEREGDLVCLKSRADAGGQR